MLNKSFIKISPQLLPHPTLPWGLSSDHITRLFYMSTLFLIACLVITFAANAFDARALDGMNVWHKPIRFGISFAIHFATLMLLSQLIELKYRVKYRFSFFAYAAVISLWMEYFYIIIQAGRGRRSHFNFETDLENIMYMLMGVGALFMVLVTFVLGILIWKYGKNKNSGLRLGAIIGLIVGSVLTLIFASYMSINVPYIEHRLGGTPSLVPYLGWSRVSGDYKPAHFVATHMMQLLPFIGWLADKYSPNFSPRKIVIISTILLSGLCGLLFWMALKGIPVYPL